jgi:hypothetical protein
MTASTIVGIYRRANAPIVERLLAPVLAAGWSTAWWALDEVAPCLAGHTVGSGNGEKLPLLNTVLERHGPIHGPLLLSDDDIDVCRGDLVGLVERCAAAGLGLGQPAHGPGSHVSHGITRRAPRSLVRLSTFVESGPLVVVMPVAQAQVLPLPDERGMGWGIELDWYDLARRGLRLGIVDEVAIRHLAKVASAYPDGELRARLADELAARGASDWTPFQRTLATWRPWQRRAPWLAAPRRADRRRPRGTRLIGRSPDDDSRPTLLVNYWYSHAVGHVVEALRVCLGYKAADPSLRISLVLNGASPMELIRAAPFVERAYAVRFTSFGAVEGSPSRALRRIPRDWDHVAHHHASADAGHDGFAGLRRYYETSRLHFRGRSTEGIVGDGAPPYLPNQTLRLELPRAERELARNEIDDRRSIAVMLAGSSSLRALYPSVTSWLEILDELARRFPGAVFSLIGRHTTSDGRTSSGIGPDEVARVTSSRHRTLNWFDRPILEQLATIEASCLFVSPHTGFGFAAVAVGTPWLTLSGGDWPEYFFNGVPFYSVLPKSREYPPFVYSKPLPMIEADADGEGPRTPSMSIGRVREDLDELGDAAAALVAGELSYDDALEGYLRRLLEAFGGDRARLRTFDDAHVGRV